MALIWLGILSATALHAADGQARVTGVVADASGGVLPGVVVTATSLDGRLLATAVTDAVGSYTFAALPPEPATISFQLEGFSPAAVDVTPKRDVETRVPTQRLALGGRAETVNVVAPAPVAAPRLPPRPTLPPPPAPPAVMPVAEHDRDSVCGPSKGGDGVSFGTIRARRYGEDKGLYVKDDQVIIEGGTLTGLAAGQNLVARRSFRAGGATAAAGDHTAGVLQVIAAGERASIAVVVYTCDEIMRGDLVAAFTPEPLRAPDADGTPVFDRAARILFGDAGQLVGAPRRLMVIDRGRDRGVRAGQRVTLFRPSRFGRETPAIIGDAVVVAVRADSATIRIERATDAVLFGDFAAAQIPAAATARRP